MRMLALNKHSYSFADDAKRYAYCPVIKPQLLNVLLTAVTEYDCLRQKYDENQQQVRYI